MNTNNLHNDNNIMIVNGTYLTEIESNDDLLKQYFSKISSLPMSQLCMRSYSSKEEDGEYKNVLETKNSFSQFNVIGDNRIVWYIYHDSEGNLFEISRGPHLPFGESDQFRFECRQI
jgi:hypothetical protein